MDDGRYEELQRQFEAGRRYPDARKDLSLLDIDFHVAMCCSGRCQLDYPPENGRSHP